MMKIENYILEIPNFPKPGIKFKDVTPILNNPEIFAQALDEMSKFIKSIGATVLVAPEARGFIFAAAIAYKLKMRLVLIRKPGKLPRDVYDIAYELEYGQNHLQVHKEDLFTNDQAVIIDDVLATGGTLKAIIDLVELSHAKVVGVSLVVDIQNLHKNVNFKNIPIHALVKY